MTPLVTAGLLALLWAIALALRPYRNRRFLGCLAIASIAFVGAGWLSPAVETLVRLLLTAVVGIAFFTPESFGIGSMTGDELRVARTLDHVRARLSSAGNEGVGDAVTAVDGLLATARVDDQWRAGLRVQRRAWAKRLERDEPRVSPTPQRAFERAAARWLADLESRRMLPVRATHGPVDEQVVLRAYLDDVRLLTPSGPIDAPVASGAWTDATEQIIAELGRVTFSSPGALGARDALVKLLTAEFELRLSGSSPEGQRHYAALTGELEAAWMWIDIDDLVDRG